MGLLHKQKLERTKYINIKDLINLISFTTNESPTDIISYLVINELETKITSYTIDLHGRIFDSEHIENYGFDYNTRLFLDEGWSQFLFYEYITYKNSHTMKCDFFYLKDDLNLIEFMRELNLDFSLHNKVSSAVKAWSNENEQNLIYREKEADFNKPNTHQLKLFKLHEFSVIEASCMLAGVRPSSVEKYLNHPEFTKVYDDYIGYKIMLEVAIQKNELHYHNSTIEAVALQKYLFSIGYIIKGFNDWLTIEAAKPLNDCKTSQQLEIDVDKLKAAQAQIAELETELEQVKAQLEEQQQAPQRTRSQTDETNTDKKLIAMLAILLAKQSNTFRIGNRPNATQINVQVNTLTMQIVDELGMNENDILGLKANTDKISKAVQAYADMFKLSKD